MSVGDHTCPPFLSPELVQSEPYTEKVDIWAAGCLLHLMATLRPPFAAPNPLALATKVQCHVTCM